LPTKHTKRYQNFGGEDRQIYERKSSLPSFPSVRKKFERSRGRPESFRPITDPHYGVGRECGVGRGLGVALGGAVAEGVGVAVGVAVAVGVGVGVPPTAAKMSTRPQP